MKNKISDTRNHLLSAMEELLDEETQITPERMERLKLVNNLGKTLVESAKAEASFVQAITKNGKFIPDHTGFVTPILKQ